MSYATGRLSTDTGHSITRAVRFWRMLHVSVRPGVLRSKGLLLAKMCSAAFTPCVDAGSRLRKARACLRQDQTDILRFDLTGFDSPEIDSQKPRTGYDGFLS